jgi:hypothetical protein
MIKILYPHGINVNLRMPRCMSLQHLVSHYPHKTVPSSDFPFCVREPIFHNSKLFYVVDQIIILNTVIFNNFFRNTFLLKHHSRHTEIISMLLTKKATLFIKRLSGTPLYKFVTNVVFLLTSTHCSGEGDVN